MYTKYDLSEILHHLYYTSPVVYSAVKCYYHDTELLKKELNQNKGEVKMSKVEVSTNEVKTIDIKKVEREMYRIYSDQVIDPIEDTIMKMVDNISKDNNFLGFPVDLRIIELGQKAIFYKDNSPLIVTTSWFKIKLNSIDNNDLIKLDDIEKEFLTKLKKLIIREIIQLYKAAGKEFNLENVYLGTSESEQDIKVVFECMPLVDKDKDNRLTVKVKLGFGLLN